MNINGTPYSGKIKFAFQYSYFHVNTKMRLINIYIVDYIDVIPVKPRFLRMLI